MCPSGLRKFRTGCLLVLEACKDESPRRFMVRSRDRATGNVKPTRGKPIGLAGPRLNRLGRMSSARSPKQLIRLRLPGYRVRKGRLGMPRYAMQQELRAQCRNGGFECGLLLSD